MVLDDDRSRHLERRAPSSPTRSLGRRAGAEALPAGRATVPQPDGRVKTSAAWLIERAGFGKGFGTGPPVSGKHTLALTNRGVPAADDLLDLARQVRAGVRARSASPWFPNRFCVGCEL